MDWHGCCFGGYVLEDVNDLTDGLRSNSEPTNSIVIKELCGPGEGRSTGSKSSTDGSLTSAQKPSKKGHCSDEW